MAGTVAGRAGCVLKRTFSWTSACRSHTDSAKTCREPLFLLSIDRYVKDLGFGVFFPEAIHASDCLYDATLSDGDCKLRVTIHPGLNSLVERNELRCSCQLRNVAFSRFTGLEEISQGEEGCPTYLVMNLEVDVEAGFDAGLEAFCGIDIDALPWFGLEGDSRPSLLPLRARRSSYLPMWNTQDYHGELWKDAAPAEPVAKSASDSGEDTEDLQPTVTIREVRQAFLSRSRVIKGILIVRILRKSRLFYYGKPDRNCECPYKAVFEVGDRSGQATVVLWNTLCMDWYRLVHPGSILRLAHYRVKESYNSRAGEKAKDDIEISLNSRNPAADISLIPNTDIPKWHLPHTPFTFCCGKEILTCPVGSTCDVIGLVVFVGRPQRTRNKDSHGVELWEYRWLQLEDGTTEQPIMVKLFSTSQPEIHSNIHPMAIMVCTNMQLMRVSPDRATSFQYLTNTSVTQVYCTGSGHHSKMPYRRLHPVRQFIQWVQTVDENKMLGRAVVGGFFTYPPLPVSLEKYIRDRNGEPGLLTGVELKREAEKLQYRESRTFAVQATVSAVSHVRSGEEQGCSALTDWTAQLSSTSSTYLRVPVGHSSPSSSVTLSPRPPRLSVRPGPLGICKTAKRRLFHTVEPPRKRLALPHHSTQQSDSEEDTDRDFSLWDASMEFLGKTEEEGSDDDDDDDDDDDEEDHSSTSSFITAPTSPCSPHKSVLGLARAASETLPRQFCPQRRLVQSAAVGLQPGCLQDTLPRGKLDTFPPADCYDGHYTITLRALADGGMVDALFLPGSPGNLHWCPYPHPHNNSWEAILSHGSFSPSAPPPAPSDLIAMATQLTGQRLVCVLEVCQLGCGRVEVVLSRAFPLKDGRAS